jgi:lipopolysaccharide transport system permease protein
LGLIRERKLLVRMVERDLRSKYVGSLIGVFWTVVNPLLLLLVFTFIFSVVFKARFGNEAGVGVSALYILCGLIPWLGFQEGVARSSSFLIENRNLVTRVKFPVRILPAVPVLSGFFGQLVGFVVLLAWAGVKGKLAMPAIFLLPVWMMLQIALALGLGYIFAVVGVWVRDVIQLIPVLLLVWMYATPIFYPANLVPEKFKIVVALNPIAQLVDGYRKMVLEGALPGMGQTLFVAGTALVCLAAGWLIFSSLKSGISDRL